jgi:hypothetical protein
VIVLTNTKTIHMISILYYKSYRISMYPFKIIDFEV